MLGRDEKIEELIIKPKDELINKLHQDNCDLYYELYNQCRLIDKAEKYEKERKSILAENKQLKEKYKNIENDYSIKLKEEIENVENKYRDVIYDLNKENNFLKKIINTLEKTINKFIHWVCKKFFVSSEEDFIRDFEKENDTYLDPEKQIEYKNKDEWDLEL